jgi:hypothetical protein
MAELSFGHNLRAKRKEVVNNTISFLPWAQGCLTACAPATVPSSLESATPVKMFKSTLCSDFFMENVLEH